MPNAKTTCLYIHGLRSQVKPAKRAILEKYFDRVYAYDIDYGIRKDAYDYLLAACRREGIDFIVGSSFGGYLGFYLAGELGLPSLLFNPALLYGGHDDVYVPRKVRRPVPFSLFVLGMRDEVVRPETTRQFLAAHPEERGIHVMECNWLPHQIDLKTFDAAVTAGLALAP